jgi:hypothetical protein
LFSLALLLQALKVNVARNNKRKVSFFMVQFFLMTLQR